MQVHALVVAIHHILRAVEYSLVLVVMILATAFGYVLWRVSR